MDTKKAIGLKKKELQAVAKNMEQSVGRTFVLGLVQKLIELEKAYSPKKVKNMPIDGTIRERAKAYPIVNLLKVETAGPFKDKARCPFHKNGLEKTPSLHVYKDNTAFCHACYTYTDVIDVYMYQNNLVGKEGFKKAIEELSKKV